MTTDDGSTPTGYDDEFALLAENAEEAGVPVDGLPPVRRLTAETAAGTVSALRFGAGPPRVVLLHGGGQNAHTWDTVVLGLGVPALAVDLPGHGHSAWREDRDYSPGTNASAVAAALSQWNVGSVPLVGMSLGGLTSIALAGRSPRTATHVVVVDVTPSVLARVAHLTTGQRGTTALIGARATFDDLDTMVDAAVAAAPRRPRASMRRGVLHNARRLPDGRWTWRYDQQQRADAEAYEQLWEDVAAIQVPITLVRGGDSAFVGDDDVAEFARRSPGLTVEVVAGAGHSVQSDRPRELAALVRVALGPG
ncbi:MAG: Pimeloyl-ACP methyl ester carboxylesterase [Blastococcus sp.]|jgi:esterase|nr:Pimeloyl-ACP methyl ester carboxylesterase [Blastococcus sp.]